jgi:hypothetical protein
MAKGAKGAGRARRRSQANRRAFLSPLARLFIPDCELNRTGEPHAPLAIPIRNPKLSRTGGASFQKRPTMAKIHASGSASRRAGDN